jgi:predicted MFS family arabinose efflux permease
MTDSSASATQSAQQGVHYGWIVVGVTFATLLTTAGAMSMPSLLLGPLQTEFGWSTATISTALSLRMAVFGLMAPFAAALMVRFGLRRMMLLAVSVTAIGVGLTAFVSQSWQLTLLWGLVVGGGTGLTALVLGATVANVWFVKHRGLVIGLMTASSASGQLLFMPAFARINDTWGWRPVVFTVAACLACLVPVIALLMRNRPSDLGIRAYGEDANAPVPPKPAAINPVVASIEALKTAARSKDFWLLSSGFLVCGLSTNGLIGTHLIAACSDAGIAATMAAGLLALMGAFDLFGTVLSGWLSDRYDNRHLLCVYYVLRGLSLLFLPHALATDLVSLSVFAAFYGLDWFATLPPTVRLTTDRFGRSLGPLVFGWMFVAHQVGAAIAALGAGWTRTLDGTYAPAFAVSGFFCIVAGLLSLRIGSKRDEDRTGATRPVVLSESAAR